MRVWAVVVAGVLGLGVLGCSDLQEEHTCPGATCTAALQGVVDDVAALDGVTRVDRVSWSTGLDNGVWGRIEVQARVDGVPAARRVARRAASLYRSGEDEEVFGLVLVVRVWKPPMEFGATIRYQFVDDARIGRGLRKVG
ncbi:hypothetical protein GCM10023349_17840 [Nocardioides conyzicola]|uniref:Lipoprotein n=2 Tax=Nocardioides conyzicola TaxID=1651781 RepID=A0ABP8X5J0_9ACTN